MKNRCIKKQFADLNLKAFLFKCLNCGEERLDYDFNGGEWEAMVECGICTAIVVFDIFNIPEAEDFFFGAQKIEGYSEFTQEAKHAIQEEKGFALLNSIPECPRCHNHNF